MHASVGAEAKRVGLLADAVDAVKRVHALAMEPRVETLTDDHHPAYLHPGRSALILLQDVGRLDASVLALAMLHESGDRSLRPADHRIKEEMGEATVALLASLPKPGEEDLVERLIGLSQGLALAVLAERLDHLRHLHLREDLVDTWANTHAEVSAAWLPFAGRVHKQLTLRYAHWARTFARRI
ncbi:MAG: hypothetical protein AAF389_11370 [Gemmatimonadota bacterium]